MIINLPLFLHFFVYGSFWFFIAFLLWPKRKTIMVFFIGLEHERSEAILGEVKDQKSHFEEDLDIISNYLDVLNSRIEELEYEKRFFEKKVIEDEKKMRHDFGEKIKTIEKRRESIKNKMIIERFFLINEKNIPEDSFFIDNHLIEKLVIN